MGYDPNNVVIQPRIRPGTQKEGFIIKIDDGTPQTLVPKEALDKWEKVTDKPMIRVTVEVMHSGMSQTCDELFSYQLDALGKTIIPQSEKSKLHKYYKYYEKLPQVGDKVICITNSDGYWRILYE